MGNLNGQSERYRDPLDDFRPSPHDFPYVVEHWGYVKMRARTARKTMRGRNLHSLMAEAVAIACRVETQYDPAGASFHTVLNCGLKSLGRRTREGRESARPDNNGSLRLEMPHH